MKSMKLFSLMITVFLIMFILFFSNESKAQNPFKVVFETYPPYEYFENNNAIGLDAEIVRNVMNNLKVNVVFEEYNWDRCLKMVETGEANGIISLFKTKEREVFLYYPTTELSYEENVLFTYKGSNIKFDGDLKKLKDYTVSIVSGYAYGGGFDEATYIKKEEEEDNETVINKVVNKRTPLGVGNILVITFLAKKMGVLDKIEFLKPSLSKDPLYIGFSKKSVKEDFVKKFSEELIKFKKTKTYTDLLKKYGY